MTSCINLVPFKGAEMYLGKQQFQVNDFMLLLLSSRSKHNFQHQTSNKGEVKHKQLVCVCVRTQTAGTSGSQPLSSHWLHCRQAHLLKKPSCCSANQESARISPTLQRLICGDITWPFKRHTANKFKWPDETEHTEVGDLFQPRIQS